MKITINSIKPFVRFVRVLTVNTTTNFQNTRPYDARMFYVLDGEGTIKANGIRYSMKKNSMIFINSGVEYHIENPKNQITYMAINFDFTFANSKQKALVFPVAPSEYDKKNLVEEITFSDAPVFNKVLYLEHIPAIEKRLFSMEKEYSTKLSLYELRLSSAMSDIIVKCFRHRNSSFSLVDGTETANKIVTYIAENYNKNLTNQQIAEVFNYHTNYVSSLIKKYTGQPLHRYIKHIRVAKAADMLLISNISIAEIATTCGFYDASHLIKCFKEIIGISPQQYRDYYI